MIKKSREMNSEWAASLFRRAPYVTVSFVTPEGEPYAVPLSLASADGQIWYFHCAPVGKKLDCIRYNPKVCLSAVTRCEPTVGPKDSAFTLQFESATATGMAEIVDDVEEQTNALRLICERFLPQHLHCFDESVRRSLHRTAVVRITLSAPPVGKRKAYDKNGDEMKWQRME